MHGVRKIEELMATDSQLADDLQLLRRLLARLTAGPALDGPRNLRTVPKTLVTRWKPDNFASLTGDGRGKDMKLRSNAPRF
jgi:hypothetical protein